MQKFINQPDDLARELLEGFAQVHAGKVRVTDGLVVRTEPKPSGKVALVTLGGSGHEPALSGFVGEGMLDISVAGDIFAAPGAARVLDALRAVDNPAGTLLVILNHDGDMLSGNMALEMAAEEHLNVRSVVTCEDVSGGPRSEPANRRGLVGCIFVYKVAGAAAEQGRSLEEVAAIAQRMADNSATLAVAASGATHPQSGQALGSVPTGEMIIGMGQHGEAGGGQQALASADQTAALMIDVLLADLEAKPGDRLALVINGTGATTLMEQYIVWRAAAAVCAERGIEVVRGACGEYLTVQEQAGFQMFVARLDDELIELWDAPANTPNWTVR